MIHNIISDMNYYFQGQQYNPQFIDISILLSSQLRHQNSYTEGDQTYGSPRLKQLPTQIVLFLVWMGSQERNGESRLCYYDFHRISIPSYQSMQSRTYSY